MLRPVSWSSATVLLCESTEILREPETTQLYSFFKTFQCAVHELCIILHNYSWISQCHVENHRDVSHLTHFILTQSDLSPSDRLTKEALNGLGGAVCGPSSGAFISD